MGDFAPGHLRGDLRLSCTWQWDTPCVHDTVTVLSQDSGTTALETAFWFWRASQRTRLGVGARLRRNAHGHFPGLNHALR